MTLNLDKCTVCNDVAKFALNINAKEILPFGREEVQENMSGLFCQLHFIERLKSFSNDLAERVGKSE